MTKPKPRIEKSNSAEADLLAALGRLRRSQPLHPEHVELRAKNQLKISIASVAREANRSRTLIASPKCAYPKVREEVLGAMQVESPAQGEREDNLTSQEVILKLRTEKRLLLHERAVLATRLQEAVNVARTLEQRLAAAIKAGGRVKKTEVHPNKLVGRTLANKNVLTLPVAD